MLYRAQSANEYEIKQQTELEYKLLKNSPPSYCRVPMEMNSKTTAKERSEDRYSGKEGVGEDGLRAGEWETGKPRTGGGNIWRWGLK